MFRFMRARVSEMVSCLTCMSQALDSDIFIGMISFKRMIQTTLPAPTSPSNSRDPIEPSIETLSLLGHNHVTSQSEIAEVRFSGVCVQSYIILDHGGSYDLMLVLRRHAVCNTAPHLCEVSISI